MAVRVIMTKTPDDGAPRQGKDAGEAIRLKLDPRLDGQAAAVLGDALRQAIQGGRTVVLEADEVERLTTSAAQVLIAADEAAAIADRPLVVKGPSEAFLSAFADLGVPAETMHWSIES